MPCRDRRGFYRSTLRENSAPWAGPPRQRLAHTDAPVRAAGPSRLPARPPPGGPAWRIALRQCRERTAESAAHEDDALDGHEHEGEGQPRAAIATDTANHDEDHRCREQDVDRRVQPADGGELAALTHQRYRRPSRSSCSVSCRYRGARTAPLTMMTPRPAGAASSTRTRTAGCTPPPTRTTPTTMRP